ncbi:MAG: class I SAM-dependent methyltransferase [Verrucomicrobia bacterium]|nr:class I SAM-dependent methyltransferase [Verrucomicrobiota bacterium]
MTREALQQFSGDSPENVAWKLLLSAEGLERCCNLSLELHLHFIHNARLKVVRTLLPPGDVILDLGGAYSPLYRMGYPHPFKKLVLIDLPPERRHQEFRRVELERHSRGGEISILYADMSELSGIDDGSVDLVWAGQVIEHLSPETGRRMSQHVFRVLRRGGSFCLDTPNGLLSSMHAATAGKRMIHPDHKIEYGPSDLRRMLKACGFDIAVEKGLCHMVRTLRSGQFSYEDFIFGNPIADEVEDSYLQYYQCVKP